MSEPLHAKPLEAVKQAISSARLSREDLLNDARRSLLIDQYNARLGGVQEKLARNLYTPMTSAATAIPRHLQPNEIRDFLNAVQSGALVYVLFAGGRATRMQLPGEFDVLGIAGLTPAILRVLASESLQPDDPRGTDGFIHAALGGSMSSPEHLSLLQRYVLQLSAQLRVLTSSNSSKHSIEGVLAGLQLVIVANSSNLETLAAQIHGVGCAGLSPSRVFFLEQSEYGGLLMTDSESPQWINREAWPLGHGEPFLAMNRRESAVFRLRNTGHLARLETTLGDALSVGGGQCATVAQVNDLHLLRDPLAAERVMTAVTLMNTRRAAMVVEVVDNAELNQKGGAIFERLDGFVEMRDTIALRIPALRDLSIPKRLSRMFYVVRLSELSTLKQDALPAYLNARQTRSGEDVLSVEYLSGDMSSTLPTLAMQQSGFSLKTFKTRNRIAAALEAVAAQDLECFRLRDCLRTAPQDC
jgi:hypothetical protein